MLNKLSSKNKIKIDLEHINFDELDSKQCKAVQKRIIEYRNSLDKLKEAVVLEEKQYNASKDKVEKSKQKLQKKTSNFNATNKLENLRNDLEHLEEENEQLHIHMKSKKLIRKVIMVIVLSLSIVSFIFNGVYYKNKIIENHQSNYQLELNSLKNLIKEYK